MQHRSSRFAFLALLAFLCGSVPLLAQNPAPILVAPDGARQGDPLLVWALTPGSLEGCELRLEAPSGALALRAPSFAAPDSLLAAALQPPAQTIGQPQVGQSVATPGPALHLFGFLFAIPTNLKPDAYRLLLVAPGATEMPSRPFVVSARDFPLERIPLDQANTDLLTEPDARKTAEARRLDALLSTVDATAVLIDGGAFLRPVVPLRRTAGFGDRRRYLYVDGSSSPSVHEGEDLAVPKGTPVLASARGKVVLCADREVTGFSVVVEHLPGLYSLYYHMSEIKVVEGQMVDRGTELGLSGSTGLSTGPHLHWELRAQGVAVNPEYWVDSPLLDTDRLKATITALFEGR